MADRDPTRTIHFVLARTLARILGSDRPTMPELLGDSILAWSITSPESTPQARSRYADTVNGAWALLAIGCTVLMVGLGYLGHVMLGDKAANVIGVSAFGGAFFCLAGCANVLWRKHYARQARRWASVNDSNTDRYRKAMQRSLPRNTSLFFQATVGIAVAVAAAIH
jgi:hypothetical protein